MDSLDDSCLLTFNMNGTCNGQIKLIICRTLSELQAQYGMTDMDGDKAMAILSLACYPGSNWTTAARKDVLNPVTSLGTCA